MSVEIENIRNLPPVDQWPSTYVYVGRRNRRLGLSHSPLANPYSIGPHGTREQVIDKYRVWLRERLSQRPRRGTIHLTVSGLVERARKERITLVCWCWPKACHAEVIRDLIVGKGGCDVS